MNTPETTLAQLEHADLIRRLLELDAAYQFKHNLIQESAYGSLLRNDRRTLHRAAAQALENAYAHDLDANAALLAKHYAEAGDEEKTYAYARRAGDAARKLSAYAEALMQYDTAALLAARLQVPVADFVALHQARGRTLELMGNYDDAQEAYRALYEIGRRRHEPQIELGALLPLATLQTFPNKTQNLDAALTANQEALRLARESGDAMCETRALWNMVLYSYFSGRSRDAIQYGNAALAIADQHGLRELRAYILNDMSRALVSTATVTDARRALEQARTIWVETQNLPMLADNLASSGEMSFIAGEIDEFERFYTRTVELCQTIGNLWNLTYIEGSRLQLSMNRGDLKAVAAGIVKVKKLASSSGFVVSVAIANLLEATMMAELGAPAQALAQLKQEAIKQSFHLMEPWRYATQAYLHALLGELEDARQDLAQARAELAPDDISNYGPIYAAICSAELSLALGNHAEAVHETELMLSLVRAAGIKYLLPELILAHARGHGGLAQWDLAVADLREAEEVARSMQNRLGLWQILAYRARFETARGNVAAARAPRAEARSLVEWIADHAPQEYRESFFARPLVQFIRQVD